jgi:hypothetical protein
LISRLISLSAFDERKSSSATGIVTGAITFGTRSKTGGGARFFCTLGSAMTFDSAYQVKEGNDYIILWLL